MFTSMKRLSEDMQRWKLIRPGINPKSSAGRIFWMEIEMTVHNLLELVHS
jgi:hypothetical protein